VANPQTLASPAMEELVARCMAKDPAKRFASMNDVLLALKRIGGLSATGTGEYRSGPPSAIESGQMSVSKVQAASEFPAPQSEQRIQHPSGSPGPTPSPLSGNLPLVFPRASGDLDGDSAIVDFTGGGRRRRKMFGAFVGIAAVATVIAVYALRSPGDEVATSVAAAPQVAQATPTATPQVNNAQPTATAPATGTAASPSPPPALPKTVGVRISSDPSGALVKEDGKEVCPSTPCDHDFDADPAKEHRLSFTKPGYRAEVRTVRIGDTPVSVRLAKSSGGWTAPVPRPQPPAPPENTPTPSGFKEIPY
jgi:serine/threonine-protein kinase